MTEHKITYLDNFLGGIEGSVFITSYKMYFKSEQNPDNSVCLAYMYMYIHIHKNIHVHVHTLYMYIHVSVFDKLIWHTIGPKSFLFGTAQFSVWASGAVNYDYIITNSINS